MLFWKIQWHEYLKTTFCNLWNGEYLKLEILFSRLWLLLIEEGLGEHLIKTIFSTG